MENFKLKKKIKIKGEIEAITGLMIGGSNTAMAIGGPDKVVIRNPVNNQPYIPGSSLKGKMRSLLEISQGKIGGKNGSVKNGPNQDWSVKSTCLFGNSKGDETQRPSRLIVRDSFLNNPEAILNAGDLPYTEAKTEVVIDRITSAANPRTFERVPSGAKFGFEMVLNIVDGDLFSEKELVGALFDGMKLLQDDYLGGSGSRGSGQVKFKITGIKERSAAFYRGEEAEKDYSIEVPSDLK